MAMMTRDAEPMAGPGGKILIVASVANVAGAPIAALRLAHGFDRRGWDAKAVFLYERAPVPAPAHPYSVLWPGATPDWRAYLRMARDVFALVRRERPDVVISFLPLAHILAQSAALASGVRRRVASHRVPINTYEAPLRQLNLLFARMGVYTAVSAVSRATLQSCAAYPARLLARSAAIPNALLDWPKPSCPRDEARLAFGFKPGEVALAAVGRLAEQKNYKVLIEAMRSLDTRFALAIAGDGPLREELEAQIAAADLKERVRLLGPLQRPHVADLLEACDIYVMPSRFEGNSNALLEALAADRPIIAHDIAEQREVLVADDGQMAGLLVPLDSVEGWIDAIRRLEGDPLLAERLRAMARRQNAAFSFDHMMDQYEKLVAA
jgi:glycosyltransferase involved in cell wall biosynthesis